MQLLSGQPETGPLPVTPVTPPAAAAPAPAPPAPVSNEPPPAAEPEELAAAEAVEEAVEEGASAGVEAMSAALQSARTGKEKEPLAAVENKADFLPPQQAPPAPRVVNASQAVKWQTASGATIPMMSVIRPERRK